MIRNFFLVAWRGLKKNRLFSFINIFGLAIGLGVCLLIAFYVANELSYDRFNLKADRIFRLDADIRTGDMFYHNWDSAVRVVDCPDDGGDTGGASGKREPGEEFAVRLIFRGVDLLPRLRDRFFCDHYTKFIVIDDVAVGTGEWRKGCRYRFGDPFVSDMVDRPVCSAAGK